MLDHVSRLGSRPVWLAPVAVATIVVLLVAASVHAQRDDLDFNRARQLRERFLRGESLTKDERAYLERARSAIQRKQAGMPKGQQKPVGDRLGVKPLTDLAGAEKYREHDGGLYGGGKNAPPAVHLKSVLHAAAQVLPRDPEGRPAPDGRVVLISVGMSNTTQEFRRFISLARRDADIARSVVLLDGAQGGMEASAWADPDRGTAAGRPDPWSVLDQRLRQAGVTAPQVQVAWIKQARANPGALGDFPKHAEVLRDNLTTIVGKLRERFPNLKLAYLSSRIYAGHATTPLNPEPYAYESAFAVRWLIRDQADGKPSLNIDPAKGKVRAPVLLWGPYLWADGMKARVTDGLVWQRDDLGADGTHPSPTGQKKVADLLLRFFKSDPTAKGWFLAKDGGTPPTR